MITHTNALSVWLADRLSNYAAEAGIAGATVAVFHDGEIAQAAAGLLNLHTGVSATVDSLFQIGSITKTFTTTLVLQLLEQGGIGLDDPVRRHLPGFRVNSEKVSSELTLRHLLTHTSGIDGEFFPDTGSDSDCVRKYVEACGQLGQVHALSESTSYCNAGFVALGALVERQTGKSWDTVLQERIVGPLGAQHMTTDYAQLPRFRTAIGHVADPATGHLVPARRLHLPRGTGPTGGTLHCSAADLAMYGAQFLDSHVGPRLLQRETVALSLVPQADWPTVQWTKMRMGLGWQLHEWEERKIFGHDGATFGQTGFVRIMPEENLVVALLTNGGAAKNLYNTLFDDIFRERAGVGVPRTPAIPNDVAFDDTRVVGSYANRLTQADVYRDGRQLMLRIKLKEFSGLLADEIWPLIPIGADACIIANPKLAVRELIVFHHFDAPGGAARLACLSHRDLPRQTSKE
jgi:CubicO group peptidase (beta-lactamase class C family)